MRAVADLRPSRAWLAHLPVATLVAAFAVRFSVLSVAVYDGYGDPPFDFALYDQGVWLLSRFHAPFVTVMGRDLFGDHTSFILLLLVPLYWVDASPHLLLTLQACLLAAAALPVYLLARRRLGTVAATALAGAYLCNPALQWGDLEQFHPEAFLVLSISLAVYAAVEDRRRLLVVAVVASALVKQDTGYLLIPLGVWVAWRRDRRLGAAIVVCCAAYTFAAFELIVPAFLGTTSFQADRIPFGGTGGLLRTAIDQPGRLADYLRSDGRPFYLWQMAASVGLGFAVWPEVALVGVLTAAENVVSAFPYQHRIIYHYSMPLVPVLVLGTVVAIARQRPGRRRNALVAVVALSALWTGTLWGLAPWSRQHYPHLQAGTPAVTAIDHVLARLPPDAVVAASYPYVAHIDHRTRVYMWPTPFAATDWGLYHQEGQRLPFADDVRWLVLPKDLTGADARTFASVGPSFTEVAEEGGVALYRRR